MGIAVESAPSLEALLAVLAGRVADAASVSQTRPNNTTSYTAGDVVGNAAGVAAATAGAALMTFTFPKLAQVLKDGGEFLITSAELERDVAALISGETTYSLYLYSAPPATVLLDNDVFDIPAADRPMYINKINLGTPVDEVSTLFVPQDGLNKQVTLRSNVIYGQLVTVGAYAPAASTVLKVTLHGMAV